MTQSFAGEVQSIMTEKSQWQEPETIGHIACPLQMQGWMLLSPLYTVWNSLSGK